MSPKLDVAALSHLSLKCVCATLVHCLAHDDERAACVEKEVRGYLSEASGDVLQAILQKVLAAETMDAGTRFACMRVALREDVRRLDTGMFPQCYYEAILACIRRRGAGVQHLNLHGVWLRDYPMALLRTIEVLPRLRALLIPHMADDLILRTALKCCPLLAVLDISGECNFTREGLKTLRSDTLRVLSIGMYGKAHVCDVCHGQDGDDDEEVNVIVTLLRNLPNLNVLKTFAFTGAALVRLQRPTKLTYVHDTRTNATTMAVICALCPLLESLHLTSPDDEVLHSVGGVQRLHTLKISGCSAHVLQEYLACHGGRLQTLKAMALNGGGFDVSALGIHCTQLRRLELYKSPLTCREPDHYCLQLESVEILYCDAGDGVVRYVLMNAPRLRRLLVGDAVRMTDGDVFRVCAHAELAGLEELWLSHARGLTATSVELLMGHCRRLRVLGQLNGWDVREDEVDLLRAIIMSSNTDLTLLPLD